MPTRPRGPETKCPIVQLWSNQTVTGTSSEARSGKDPDVELSRASEETSEDSRTKGAPILALIQRDYTAYAQQVYGRASNYIETVGSLSTNGRCGIDHYMKHADTAPGANESVWLLDKDLSI
ncbi:predicted protein [Postia placenta Mad-698-R]|nr:predicted protein [Postia placenta Mad-698-R]